MQLSCVSSALYFLVNGTACSRPLGHCKILTCAPYSNALKGCDHWTQVQENYLSREFAKLRDTLPHFKDLPSEQKPSFYEIKALGGHHYMNHYGWTQEQVSALMGHTNVKMTKTYTDRHIQWSEVAVE